MSRKFLTAIDLAKNELQNAAVQSLAAAPSTPVKFQLYGDTTNNTLFWWNGTSWISASGGAAFPGYGAVPAETTFGIARADGVAATVARSDHTHGSPTHTDADHAAIHLNALAAPTATVNMGGQIVSNIAPAVSTTDAVQKQYVDNRINGLSWKTACVAASTANIATLSGLIAVDGVTPIVGDNILVKNQTTQSANGIYTANTGAWSRSAEMDSAGEVPGASVYVTGGTTQADTAWAVTSPDSMTGFTLGTSNIVWGQVAGPGTITAGTGLTSTGNTLNVGAGTGITVQADTVSLDTAYTDARYATAAAAAKRFAADCAAATTTTVTHNFATQDVIVAVYNKTTPFDEVDCDIQHATTNTVTVGFAVAPTAGQYRIVVMA